MKNGKRAGLFVTVLVDHLNPRNPGLVKSSKPPKSKLGNQGSYKESNTEGCAYSEVIDSGDVEGRDWPPLKVVGDDSVD